MNINKFFLGAAIGALIFGNSAVAVFAAGFSNGSFETGTNPGAYTTLSAGDSTTIPGWTVGGPGGIDYIGTYWTASDGSRSLDMSGTGIGSISQTFDTVSGHPYKVTFDMAGNPAGPPTTKTLKVDAGGPQTSYTFNITGKTTAAMGWASKTFNFTANGSSTTLTFTSADNTSFGPALDNVVIEDLMPAECQNMTFTKVIVATSDNQTINGTGGNDLIIAKGGTNTINGGGGDDCLVGGGGKDTINGGSGNDIILGKGGNDTLNGDSGNDTIKGGAGTDSANGGSGIDSCDAETTTQCE